MPKKNKHADARYENHAVPGVRPAAREAHVFRRAPPFSRDGAAPAPRLVVARVRIHPRTKTTDFSPGRGGRRRSERDSRVCACSPMGRAKPWPISTASTSTASGGRRQLHERLDEEADAEVLVVPHGAVGDDAHLAHAGGVDAGARRFSCELRDEAAVAVEGEVLAVVLEREAAPVETRSAPSRRARGPRRGRRGRRRDPRSALTSIAVWKTVGAIAARVSASWGDSDSSPASFFPTRPVNECAESAAQGVTPSVVTPSVVTPSPVLVG